MIFIALYALFNFQIMPQTRRREQKKMGRLYDGRRDRPVAWWQIKFFYARLSY
jgi:hypothetical protein